MTKIVINNREYDFEGLVALMDDEIREELHSDLAPCTEQEFTDAYLAAHKEKYGTEFKF